jgi:hypothetical protein
MLDSENAQKNGIDNKRRGKRRSLARIDRFRNEQISDERYGIEKSSEKNNIANNPI